MRIAIVGLVVCTGCFDWESLSPEAVCSTADPPAVAVNYIIHRLPLDATISAGSNKCDEAFWTDVPVIELEAVNPTNNTLSCRIVWDPARSPESQDVVYGCCVGTDTDLQAASEPTTPDQEVYFDDEFEYILTLRPNTLDDTTTKIAINIKAAVWDVNFDNGGDYDISYNAAVLARANTDGQTINDASMLDTGYTIKWRANVGFTVPAPHVAGCGFMSSDNDDGVRMIWNAYGTGREDINDPAKWGRCLFSCSPPPSP